MNKKLKKGLTISTAAMAMGVAVPVVTVMAAPVTANGWVLEGTTWYYYVNGVKLVNAWAQDSKGWCWLGADGAAIKEGWAKDSIGWCYITNYNWDKTSTWRQDSAGWQFIGANGYWDASIPAKATNPLDVFEVGSVSVVDATHIKVVFTQVLDATTAEDTANYKIGTKTIDEANLQADGKTVVLKLAVGSALSNDEDTYYTVKVNDVETAGGKVIADYKENFNLYDNVKPTLESVDLIDRDTVQVTFNEIVTQATALTGIDVLDEDGNTIDGLTVIKDTDTTDGTVWNVTGLSTLDEGDYTLKVSGVKDLATNKIVTDSQDFALAEDNVDPTVKSIAPLSLKAFKVTFSEPISGGAFTAAVAGFAGTYNYEVVSGSGNKEFVVTLSTAYAADITKKVTITGYSDNAANAGSSYSKYIKFSDKAITVESTEATIKSYNGAKYAVYTLPIDADYYLNTANQIDAMYTDADGAVINATIADGTVYVGIENDADATIVEQGVYSYSAGLNLDADQFAIKITGTGLAKGDYTVTLPDNFVSANGANFDETDVTFTASTSTAGSVKLTKIEQTSYNTYLVYYDGEVTTSALDLGNYAVDGSNVFSKASFTDADKDTVKLTVGAGEITDTDYYAFTTSDIVDANGKEVEDYDSSDVNVATTGSADNDNILFSETVGPYIENAAITDVNTIKVKFNEVVTGTVNADDFDVYIDGVSVKVTGATPNALNNVWTVTVDNEDLVTSDDVKVATSSDFDGKDIVIADFGSNGSNNTVTGANSGKKGSYKMIEIDSTVPTVRAIAAGSSASALKLKATEITGTAKINTTGTVPAGWPANNVDINEDIDGYITISGTALVANTTITFKVSDAAGNEKAYTAKFTAVGATWVVTAD